MGHRWSLPATPRWRSWWTPRPPSTPPTRRPWPGAIERGLLDGSFRRRLVAWSARPRPGWSEVAERAAAVYRALATESDGRPRRPAAWRRRPQVALVTPWPPATTGVASYSRRLARALSDHVEVELFLDGDTAAEVPDDPGFASYPAWSLPVVDPVRGGYDAVVASVGNSEHHAGALGLVRRDRLHAAVLAHDVRLNGLYRHGAARGAVPEGNAAVVTSLYEQASEEWITDGWLQPAEAEAHGVYLARELIGLADPFIVTSEFAAGLARSDARPEDRGRVVVCPYAYPAAVPRSPGDEQPGLVVHLRTGQRGQAARTPLGGVRPRPPGRRDHPAGVRGAGRPRPVGAVPRPGRPPRGGRGGGLHRRSRRCRVRGVAAVGRRWRCSSGPAPTARPREPWPTACPTAWSPWSPTPDRPDSCPTSWPRCRPMPRRRRWPRLWVTCSATPSSASARSADGLAFVTARGFDRGARQLLDVLGLTAPGPARPGSS